MKMSQPSGAPTVQQLTALADRLRAAPVREYQPWREGRALSKIEAVAFLKNELVAMRDKGYGVVEIAALLSDAGLRISAAGLYGAMRKLGCSLSRPSVTAAEKLRHHLYQETADEHPDDAPAESSGASGLVSGPLDMSAVQGPAEGIIHVEPMARPLMRRLSPTHSLMYQEVLKQLRIGKQAVRLEPPLSDIKDVFMELGLLTTRRRRGEVVYEVPAKIAFVRAGPAGPVQPRRVGSRRGV